MQPLEEHDVIHHKFFEFNELSTLDPPYGLAGTGVSAGDKMIGSVLGTFKEDS